MKKNMGSADRVIRILAAVVFAVLYFTGTVTGMWGIALLVFGAVFLATSFAGFCPLYTLFGMDTCPAKNTTPKV
jgi:fatty acid desaturase